ncbi:zinc resistance-associated protein [hydrocarbon metagenome]|uniref:Zinc resistance-associated protein n=1 Tax=hydrocarbon metagenome TaxID=938273 RepID=A0A0W8FSZ7_9ZZZZ
MKKLISLSMIVLTGIILTTPAFAFGMFGGRGPGYWNGERYCNTPALRNLNLSAEQKTKIEALISENQKSTKPLRDKMFDKSLELRRLWSQTNPDRNKIYAAQKEVRALRDEMQDKRMAMRLEIRKILTQEQNEKLANSYWGRGPGFVPRGGMRGHGGHSRVVYCP